MSTTQYEAWTSEGGVQIDLPFVTADSPEDALVLAVAAFRSDLPTVADYGEGDTARETINVEDGYGCLSENVAWSESDR